MVLMLNFTRMWLCCGLLCWLRQYRACLPCRRPRSHPWVGKIPWRREWLPTRPFLPGESLQSTQSQRVKHDWVFNTTTPTTNYDISWRKTTNLCIVLTKPRLVPRIRRSQCKGNIVNGVQVFDVTPKPWSVFETVGFDPVYEGSHLTALHVFYHVKPEYLNVDIHISL